jgi:hypothetical protein
MSNMYVKIGDTILALPRAFEVGELFGAIPSLMMDSIRKKDGNDVVQGMMEFGKRNFLIEPVPQFIKPIFEVVSNTNSYTGQPIENLSDKRKLKSERFDEYTSGVAKALGPVTGAVNLSPKQVDTLIRGYFGTLATTFLATVDGVVSSGGTRPAGFFGDPASLPGIFGTASGLSRLLKTEGQINNKFIGDFYEIKQKVTEIVSSINEAARTGDTETVKKRIEQMPAARGLYTSFNSASESLGKINAQMDIIRKSKTMDADQKATALEKLQKAKGSLSEQMVNAANKVGVYI